MRLRVASICISRPASMLMRRSTFTAFQRRRIVSSGSSEKTSTENRSGLMTDDGCSGIMDEVAHPDSRVHRYTSPVGAGEDAAVARDFLGTIERCVETRRRVPADAHQSVVHPRF